MILVIQISIYLQLDRPDVLTRENKWLLRNCKVLKSPLVTRIPLFFRCFSLVTGSVKPLMYGRATKSRCESDGSAN